jgi:predicted small integral membrane protein
MPLIAGQSPQRKILINALLDGVIVTARYSKIVMSLALAAFAFVTAFNNLTDYDSNFMFVRHVLSMDTLFPNNRALHRAITTPWMWHAAYWLIIAGQMLTAALLYRGTWSLWRARHGTGAAFARAKQWTTVGLTTGFVLWFFGFMVVGAEWFMMWQSQLWNGQEAAFKFYMAILGVQIFLNQPDQDLA